MMKNFIALSSLLLALLFSQRAIAWPVDGISVIRQSNCSLPLPSPIQICRDASGILWKLNVSGTGVEPVGIDALTSSGTSNTIKQTGDDYGETSCTVLNRDYYSGEICENKGLDLFDFILKTSTGSTQNIRYEHRSNKVYSGNTAGQWEIGPADDENIFIGAARSGIKKGIWSVYGLYTDENNFERLSLTPTPGTGVTIAPETMGSGADNLALILSGAGTGPVKLRKTDMSEGYFDGYITIKSSNGTVFYIYPDNAGTSLIISTTVPGGE